MSRPAVIFDRASIVFGDNPERALPLMDQGKTRAEVQQLHDNPPTELVGLDGFLTATPSPARRLSLTDATRQGD